MAKTVQLSEKAYAALAAQKRQGESFSDEVLRLLGERRNPRVLKNLSKPRDGFDLESVRGRMRAGDLKRMQRLDLA